MHEHRRFWTGNGSDHMPIHHRAIARQLWLTWAIGLVVVCWWDFTGWDRAVMHLWGDAQGFSLEHHPLLETWLHERLRILGWLLYGSCWLWAIWPHESRMAGRTDRMALMGVVTLNLLLVNVLKLFSSTSCPWSVAEWGALRNTSPIGGGAHRAAVQATASPVGMRRCPGRLHRW